MVVGKDIVPRIGLHQLERLRHQLMETLEASTQPKVNPNCLREITVELKRSSKNVCSNILLVYDNLGETSIWADIDLTDGKLEGLPGRPAVAS